MEAHRAALGGRAGYSQQAELAVPETQRACQLPAARRTRPVRPVLRAWRLQPWAGLIRSSLPTLWVQC